MLVLASASPRRRELLTQAGYSFQVHPAQIPEDPLAGEDPVVYVTRLALEKAQAVFALLSTAAVSDLAVLGADTTVTLEDPILRVAQILGKPADAADAARMLRQLAGRSHRVVTGVALVTSRRAEAVAEITTVSFHPLTERQIAAYVATGEPMDKAGAYAIQGRAAAMIPRIEGCYSNVVGLPLARVSALLAAAGIHASGLSESK
jgi:septum formation protein